MEQVKICEMAPRDGLQFLGGLQDPPRLVPLDLKLALVQALLVARLPYIEVGAFVSAKVTPQMADTDELCRQLGRNRPNTDTQLAGLVPNLKHYERFAGSGLDTVAIFVSASESYAQANTRASVSDLVAWAAQVAQAAGSDGKRVRAHVSAAFQDISAVDAESDLATVIRVSEQLCGMGCECISLADTNGQTNPRRVRQVLDEIKRSIGLKAIAVHLHDRNGAGMANALAALDSGVRTFDASVGGIGGSVFAASPDKKDSKGTAGNIATEELADMLYRMGVQTGIQQEPLLRAGEIIYRITQATGDFAPPSKLLREHLGYGLIWTKNSRSAQ